ncbi:hypothetical protein EYW49_19315 [Siculibacillus lacustris]|uniref:Magnesium transporter CorA n=1 Tax=Siculibacillus lacustris TaxID=1549641 RepID=A0A4Q9VGD0_9HYPH|nr:CorA family divalent cation transporter [Siculibacillus lacustris]TBW33880.1 hypothetical protein EYW49_19315 [Siculibacillus lacustris]
MTAASPLLVGLVWAHHFPADGGRSTPIPEGTPLADLPADGFLWLHFALPDFRVEPLVAALPGMPREAAATLVSRDRHLFVTVVSPALAGVMPDFQQDLDGQSPEVDRFRFIVTERYIVTTRNHPLRSMAAMRSAMLAGRGFRSPIELFGAISEFFEQAIEDMLDEISDDVDKIQDELFKGVQADLRARLGGRRREVAQIHRTLRTTARLFHRLDAQTGDHLPAGSRAVLERRSQHLSALDQDVVLIDERARLLYEEIGSRIQDQINHRLYVLSLATVVLMPPTFVTGFFGMNTKDMFLQDVPDGTLWAAGIVVATALAALTALHRFGSAAR